LFAEYGKALSGDSHLLLKMTSYWEYFSTTFSNPQKCFKKIKKAKSVSAYEDAVQEILKQEREI
jgi:tRNA-dihydrouridine synthase B